MALLSSNLPINKIKSSFINDTGLIRSIFNAFTDFFGGPLTDEGIAKLTTQEARTKSTKKQQKLGVKATSLTDAQKERLSQLRDIRNEIESTYGKMEEDSLKDEHMTGLINTANNKAYERYVAGAGKADYNKLTDDAAKEAFKKDWVKNNGINLDTFKGEGKTVAEQMKNIYGGVDKEIGTLTQQSQISDMARLQSMFYDGDQLSYGRLAGMGAIGYGAANIVGSGSLGIPFISTASWNR